MKKGSCLCNAVQFIVKLENNGSPFNCHCIDCRKATGSAFALLIKFKIES